SVAFFQRDLPKAVRMAEEGLAIARAAGCELDTARLLHNLGRALVVQGRCQQAVENWREAIDLFQKAGDSWGVADALVSMGRAAFEQGDLDAADRLFAHSLALFREIGDPEGTALALLGVGRLAQARGAAAKAAARFHDVLALLNDRSTRPQAVHALLGLGAVAFDHGDLPTAAERWRDALQRARARDDRLLIASGLERFARLAAASGWRRHSARLLAVAASLRIELGAPVAPSEADNQERLASSLRSALGPEGFAAAGAGVAVGKAEADPDAAHDVAGRRTGAEIAVATTLREAVAVAEAIIAPAPERRPSSLPLSARERDVLRLLAEGRTDREIAAALSLSYRTVTTHVTAILSKLDVESRTAAAVYAVRSGLA
ncbi:MAG TPA: LuxR C-terminal-related transcriptional regulator, partial [Thermomicrobiales bacterium]|nr:LuxR C-terminal-related transcriptional regulator [Thermomicrobiales bacterium]